MDNSDSEIKAVKIKLLFFGSLAESMGQREIEVVLTKGTVISQLLDRFQLSDIVNNGVKVAINGEIIQNHDEIIADSSEVAFLPPFSGG
ncbi:MAG: MoaD/ThiS family protein [Candidatus Poseidoniales archaeon]|nr:MAG: MoaD/ThiS family protein [Candidatus Poseidoniales archaeon]